MKNTIPSTSLVALFTLTLLFVSCSNNKKLPPKQTAESYCIDDSFKEKMALERPKLKKITENIPLTGVVETNPDKVVNFMSLVDGIISHTYFSLGDQVKKGQVLADLRSAELAELYAQSKTIVSQIRVSEQSLKATQAMFDDGISSQKEMMNSESELAILKANKDRIESQLSLFSASPEKGVFKITAPHSGIVTAKSITAGGPITAGGESLFIISDLNDVWVMVDIYASNVRNITANMEVDIKTLSYPGESFKGKITTISQVLDNESKVLKARVVLPNTDFKLKPGMLVDVSALKTTEISALSIPTDALVFDNNKNFVVVYKDDCDMEIRQVKTSSKGNGNTFIVGGLEENERIVSKNHLLIYEQLKNFQK
ncbi:MAG: efflux RND transporter periplasmic adaptor subunit [Aequorivita sp.]